MGLTYKTKKSPTKVARRPVGARRSITLSGKPLFKDLTAPSNPSTQLSNNIKVTVRVRPQNEREINANQRSIIKVLGDHMLIFDPKEDEDDFFYHGVKQRTRDLNKKANRNVDFTFDRVFGMESTNEEVFEGTTKDVVQAVMDGYNCSVFAYGATGAGKTHSMVGTLDNPGIIFLTVMELYNRMDASKIDTAFEVAVSYLEVYNETIRDLLASSEPLNIRDDGNNGIAIPGLTFHKPGGAQDLLAMLEVGNKNRSQHPTDHNAESSRSHAVFQILVKQRDKGTMGGQCRMAKMSLIDLAGSERGSSTNFKGERFREGTNINRSLLALGNCINALAEGRKHINYRDSKLTRLLKDSLGGNCKTVMIAAISPSSLTYEDTYNTLKYADRAKKIKSVIKKNIRAVDFHVAQYEQIIGDLKSQVEDLKNKLQEAENAPPQIPAPSNRCVQFEPSFREIKQKLDALFHEKRELRRKLMQLASEENKLRWRDAWNQTNNQRVKAVNLDILEVDRFEVKTQRLLSLTSKKLAKLEAERIIQEMRLGECDARISQVVDEWKQLGLEHLAPEQDEENGEDRDNSTHMDLVVRMKQLEVQLQDSQDRQVYQQRMAESQNTEEKRTEKLMSLLLKTVKQQHLQLKMHDKLLPVYEEDYKNLVSMVEARSVSWPDQTTNLGSVTSPSPSPQASLPKLFERLPVLDQTVQLSPLSDSQPVSVKPCLTSTNKLASFTALPGDLAQEKPISSLKSSFSSVQLPRVPVATPPNLLRAKSTTSVAINENSPDLKPRTLVSQPATSTSFDFSLATSEYTALEDILPQLDTTVTIEQDPRSIPIETPSQEIAVSAPAEEVETRHYGIMNATVCLDSPGKDIMSATVCLDSPAKETNNGLDATYVANTVYEETSVPLCSAPDPVHSRSVRRETFDIQAPLPMIQPTVTLPVKDKENFIIPVAPKPLNNGKSSDNTPNKIVAVVRRALTPKMKKTVSKSMTTLHDHGPKPTYMNSTTASKLRVANGQVPMGTSVVSVGSGKRIVPTVSGPANPGVGSKGNGARTFLKSTSVAHLKSNS